MKVNAISDINGNYKPAHNQPPHTNNFFDIYMAKCRKVKADQKAFEERQKRLKQYEQNTSGYRH